MQATNASKAPDFQRVGTQYYRPLSSLLAVLEVRMRYGSYMSGILVLELFQSQACILQAHSNRNRTRGVRTLPQPERTLLAMYSAWRG
jgi:hypothetical protein